MGEFRVCDLLHWTTTLLSRLLHAASLNCLDTSRTSSASRYEVSPPTRHRGASPGMTEGGGVVFHKQQRYKCKSHRQIYVIRYVRFLNYFQSICVSSRKVL